MNLEKLLLTQRELLSRIIKENELEDKDLVADTFLALQVELAEFANEGRWFKYWSNDQTARIKKVIECSTCCGTGDENYEANIESMMEERGSVPYKKCISCDGAGLTGYSNPLLEEFVDGFHLFMQIAILKKWEDALYIYEEQLDPDEFDGDLTAWQLEVLYFINKSYYECPSCEQNEKWINTFGFPESQYHFRTAWILFLNIGINGFGFTPEQIESAYMQKNEINLARQENGY